MVNGIQKFIEAFQNYQEQYTIIGGVACDTLMDNAGLEFRPTADIDMVITVEALTTEFAEAFWDFITAGGYQAWENKNGEAKFYRFDHPADNSYPKMIELFSRPKSGVILQPNSHLMPLPVAEEISSLSAILLNEDYYQFLLNGRFILNGISILDAEHIIPFKMKAWLDLKEQKAAGEHINSRDIKKHRADVFRLSQLLRTDITVSVPDTIAADIQEFIDAVAKDSFEADSIKLRPTKNEILDVFRKIYITSKQ